MASNGRVTKKEALALKTAYNAIMAASFSLSAQNTENADKILNAALRELNSNYTKEVQKAIGIR